MAAGSIVIDLLMKTGAFETDTKRAEKRLKEFEKSVKTTTLAIGAIGIAAGAAFGVMVKKSIDTMDAMSKMAQSAGVSVEALSSLGYAADLSGLSAEQLASNLGRLTKGMADAVSGTGEAKKAFDLLGINAGTMRSADEALLQIADKFAVMDNGAQKTALAIQLFGKSGMSMIPFLNQGREGLAAMQAEASRLGITLSTEAAQSAEQFNDNIFRLTSVAQGLFNQIASSLLPVLTEFTAQMFNASVETDETSKAANDLGKNKLPEWVKGLTITFAALADSVIFVLKSVALVDKFFDGLGKKFDVIGAKMDRFALTLKTPLIGDTPDYLQKDIDTLDSKIFNLSMTAIDAHDEVSALFAEASKMQFLNAARTSFDSVSVAPTAFSPRGGGAGTPISSGAPTPFKISDPAKDFLKDMQKEADAYVSFLGEITGKSDSLRKEQEQEWLRYAKSIGDITTEEFDLAMKKLNATESELSQFAIQAARNIQDILGDGLYNALSGRFANIGTAFAEMITKMSADLMASQVAKFLFGNYGESDQMGGIIGQIVNAVGGAIGGSFGTTSAPMAVASNNMSFATGGYTGEGGKYEPAGVVHRGEFVVNANSTKKLGVGFLDRLNKGYANGGYVGSAASAMSGGVNINIKNEAGRDGYQATATVNKNEGGLNVDVIVRKAIANDLRNNGQIAQQMSATFGLRRSV